MKACIIGFARSRSSILLETISLFYKVPILGDDINNLTQNLNTPPSSDAYKSLLAECFDKTEGVIRFHPFQILEMPHKGMCADFDLFKFEQYDKIYFTYRESVSDIIASEIVARKLKKYTYKSKEELVTYIPPITVNVGRNNINAIIDYVHYERAVIKLKQYFKDKGILSQDLYYDEIPKYLEETFPGVDTFHVETNYNYRKIITNYDDIIPLYEYYKKIIQDSPRINMDTGGNHANQNNIN